MSEAGTQSPGQLSWSERLLCWAPLLKFPRHGWHWASAPYHARMYLTQTLPLLRPHHSSTQPSGTRLSWNTPQWTLRRGGLGTVENAAFLPPPLGGAMMETWSSSLRSYTNPHALTNFGMSVKPLGFSWIPLCYLVSDEEEAPFTSATGWGGTGGSHTDKLSKDPEKASSQNSSWLPP